LIARLVVIVRQFDVLQAVYAIALVVFKVLGSFGTSPNLVYSGVEKVVSPSRP
jgi:N-methylhydantoinase B